MHKKKHNVTEAWLRKLLHSLREFDKYKDYMEKAFAIRIEIGHRDGEAISQGNLGTLNDFLIKPRKFNVNNDLKVIRWVDYTLNNLFSRSLISNISNMLSL